MSTSVCMGLPGFKSKRNVWVAGRLEPSSSPPFSHLTQTASITAEETVVPMTDYLEACLGRTQLPTPMHPFHSLAPNPHSLRARLSQEWLNSFAGHIPTYLCHSELHPQAYYYAHLNGGTDTTWAKFILTLYFLSELRIRPKLSTG